MHAPNALFSPDRSMVHKPVQLVLDKSPLALIAVTQTCAIKLGATWMVQFAEL